MLNPITMNSKERVKGNKSKDTSLRDVFGDHIKYVTRTTPYKIIKPTRENITAAMNSGGSARNKRIIYAFLLRPMV